jgi:23S rRNA (guanosine2251-2'-O)-methyltransferase
MCNLGGKLVRPVHICVKQFLKIISGLLPLPMRKLEMDELGRKSVNEFRESAKNSIVVLLENIRSMHNVGSVFRTADAFLLQSIYLCGYTPRPPHRDIHKTALGATETVEWQHFADIREAMASLRQRGYKILAVEQVENSTALQQLQFHPGDKLALLFGNEVEGVSKEALSQVDGCIEIPQLGMKHSLNISVAAGIVLWELVKTRMD